MKRLIGLTSVSLMLLAGCGKHVTIYRNLGEGNAMKTCDANTRFRAEAKGRDAADAKAKVEAEIRASVTQNNGCGAFIFNEGSGRALDGNTNHVADYQLCTCGP